VNGEKWIYYLGFHSAIGRTMRPSSGCSRWRIIDAYRPLCVIKRKIQNMLIILVTSAYVSKLPKDAEIG
jgi:hypothetical protein